MSLTRSKRLASGQHRPGSKCAVHDCDVGVQATFEKLENEMKEINSNAEALKRNFLDLTELKHILRKTQSFFDEVSWLRS